MAVQTRRTGRIAVAAIDFGTTYSGYAYSFKHEFERDPLKIYTNTWNDGMGLITHKAPTTVLFDKTGAFHSFGYEAEEKYAELSSSDKHTGWKYFKRFKMVLHNQSNLRLKTKLRDDQGKRMDAIKVFSAAINYLRKHMVDKLNESLLDLDNNGIQDVDILWVLTVPAIWGDSAKQFMRLAAVQGGIPENQLRLALEPEAAAVFSIKEILSKENIDASAFERDSKFMVIDLGGGTVDITVHKVAGDGKFHEIYPPSGGPWGGTLVDEKMYEFIENIFGSKVLQEFKEECASDNLDMLRTLELKKRAFRRSNDDDFTVNLTLSSSLFELYEIENPDFTIADKLKELFQNSVVKRLGRLIIRKNLIENMFKESVDNIKGHLHTIFRKPDMKDVNIIIMVGGYSECDVLRGSLNESFRDKQIIFPEGATSAVLKGISTAVPFDPQLHSEIHKYNGMCEDVFKVFVAVGTDIKPGETQVKHLFNSGKSNVVEIYKSISETPAYTTDSGCNRIGQINIDSPADNPVLVEVTMMFGDTELHVEAKESGTENTISAKFKFVS